MASVFEAFRRFGPAAFVLKAIMVAAGADVLFLGFILLRRAYRKHHFRKHDARMLEIRQKWHAIVSGQVPYETWRTNAYDRRIIETIALDNLEGAGPAESARLLKFLRASGLVEKSIFEARNHRGWRRQRALVALGRTRAIEGIPALAEALHDRQIEIRLAALRGLGRTASPEAAKEILEWMSGAGVVVPALPLQNALIQTCAERPRMLLPYLQHAEGREREVLARVLGEVASPSMGMDLLQFAADDLPELRAASARALSQSDVRHSVETLNELVDDPVWFVRLRAVVSLGKLSQREAILPLLRGLTDSNRLVRLRAGEALLGFRDDMVGVFERVVATRDKYGLHAYLTALDNAALQPMLEAELDSSHRLNASNRDHLLSVLRTGTQTAGVSAATQPTSATAGGHEP